MGTTSSFLRRLKTEATLRTLREMLRPRPRLVSLSLSLVVVAVAVDGGLKRAGLTVVALSDLPITRTGSSAAVMVLRRRWPTEWEVEELLEWSSEAEVEVEAELELVLVVEAEAQVDIEAAVLTEDARDGAGLG